jgi:hypothetical protein
VANCDPLIRDYFQKRKAMLDDPAENRAVATRPSSDRPHRGCGMSAAPRLLPSSSVFLPKRSGAAMYPACFRLEDCLPAMRPLWPLALM